MVGTIRLAQAALAAASRRSSSPRAAARSTATPRASPRTRATHKPRLAVRRREARGREVPLRSRSRLAAHRHSPALRERLRPTAGRTRRGGVVGIWMARLSRATPASSTATAQLPRLRLRGRRRRREPRGGLEAARRRFNIGTGVETTVNALWDEVAKACGSPAKAAHEAAKPGEQRRSVLDAAKGRAALGLPVPSASRRASAGRRSGSGSARRPEAVLARALWAPLDRDDRHVVLRRRAAPPRLHGVRHALGDLFRREAAGLRDESFEARGRRTPGPSGRAPRRRRP